AALSTASEVPGPTLWLSSLRCRERGGGREDPVPLRQAGHSAGGQAAHGWLHCAGAGMPAGVG
ncbi:unnamed protein product, partial [Effrenium voratum]